ncbi:endonuclease/exonuclease/phosphatase family protein [Aequorivita marina]|uniref:endonuclease/exonuclease/phosphatase family protein n=1 Tax=Aequorivita marina TaxID=3073654 RepID=UPI002875E457|nr:endonuclease/exonuclease/phosphatase family protein [Aequorivita sp. S2608]MDS1299378.1 endonuclease/exonuclease/phosphatase family protein [Aequorivita sp. S2608]
MKRFFNTLIYWGNLLVAFLLLVSFILPYLPPKSFPTLSLLSLFVPLIIILNIIFALYWAIQLRARFFLSFIVLFVSYFYFNVFYEVSEEGDASQYKNTLSVLSYNVRIFNGYEKNSDLKIKGIEIMSEILKKHDPDVLCIQEYYRFNKIDLSAYPYKYIHYGRPRAEVGYAYFSKYPLINTGGFDFTESSNNTLYADVVKGEDTIRVYNVHLQSMGISPRVTYLQEVDNEKLKNQISSVFEKQQNQINTILKHQSNTNHPIIVCGDFNNTPFSYSYRMLKNDMQDAFRERGNGLGTTFDFDGFPMRIDYILASKGLDFLNFETINKTFSDHRAILARVGW